MVINYTLCRLCYEREASVSIFCSGNDVQILCKIVYCCKTLNVQENDGLPARICSRCECELEACCRFLRRCEAADRALRSTLHTPATPCDDFPKTEVKTELSDNHHEELLPSPPGDFMPDYLLHELNETKCIIRKIPRNRIKSKAVGLLCSVCKKKCENASALAAHMRMHSDEKPFQCSSCDKKYKDKGTLNRHIERKHLPRERKFICETCGKGFFSKRDIKFHMRVHTGETPYVCLVCESKFTQQSALIRHKKLHMGEACKTHTCGMCHKSFHTKDRLKTHQTCVHDEARNFPCPVCHVRFKLKGTLNKHMDIHSDLKRFVCNHCGWTFNVKGSLKTHIKKKHSEKSGYCDVCCKNVPDMEVHRYRHSGEKPLQCEFCPSSFYELRGLALHVNFKHKKTDRYKCSKEGCALSFPSRPMMMYHIAKFHDMQTPFPCNRCSRGFYRKSDLGRHMIGTHKEKLL